MTLLKLRAARLGTEEVCAVDSTSRSAWGESLPDIQYGKSKIFLFILSQKTGGGNNDKKTLTLSGLFHEEKLELNKSL